MNEKEYYLNEISKLTEAGDFMNVLRKWDVLSSRIKPKERQITVLPDLLWVTKPGVGKTHLLKLLSEYLYESKTLMEFYGDVKFLEFMLDYRSPDDTFNEVNRMINEISNAAGFRSIYRGIVSVDIDEWLGHCEEKHFIRFLEYLAGNSEDWMIIFNTSGERENELKKLESVLSMYFRIEKSYLNLPNTSEMIKYVADRLSAYGLSLNADAETVIFNVIEKMRGNKYFDGYKTLNNLYRDIIYEVCSDVNYKEGIISADNLKRFVIDGDYITRMTWRLENKRNIGFLNRSEN